jgi:acyl carrier protein
MKRADFFSELKDTLMIDNVDIDENTEIHLTSLSTLSIIAFLDEYFDKQVKAIEIRNIHSVSDLIKLIGKEHIV